MCILTGFHGKEHAAPCDRWDGGSHTPPVIKLSAVLVVYEPT